MAYSHKMTLKWGIFSTGYQGHEFAKALHDLDSERHVIQAVAGKNYAEAKKFAQEFNIPSFYDTNEDLANDKDVNVVYIGGAHSMHKKLSLMAIEEGKHVLCEAPMSLTVKDQEDVFRAAKRHNVFFMEGISTRFFPVIDKIRDEIVDNSIGEIRYVISNYMDQLCINNEARNEASIMDLGIYPIQLACMIFQHEMPERIQALGSFMKNGEEESASISLLYSGGRMANLNISRNCGKYSGTQIIGESGLLQIPDDSHRPSTLILSDNEKFEKQINANGLDYEIEAVRKAIENGKKEHPFVEHEHSQVIMKIVSVCRKLLASNVASSDLLEEEEDVF